MSILVMRWAVPWVAAVLLDACAHAPVSASPPLIARAQASGPSSTSTAPAPSPGPSSAAEPGPDASAAQLAPTAKPTLHDGILRRLGAPFAGPCTESDLPAPYRGTQPRRVDDGNLGRGIAIALPHGTVLARRQAKTEVAVYLSYKLDPSSEVGDAGYRVLVRGEDGRTRDGSLGFAMLRPYVVLDNPKLPAMDGDTLQLAVDVQEVDDKSITFPPVALRALREAHDRMLRCPLAAVFLDTDGDGLADVEEARLATDPNDADTDGDGLRDGDDPAPLGAEAPKTPEDGVRAAAFKQIVAKEVGPQLLVTKGQGTRFDLRDVPMRLLELRDDEFAAYEKRFGMRISFDVGVKMLDPDRAQVDVNFGWRGLQFVATRHGAGGRWTFMKSGEWITRSADPDPVVADLAGLQKSPRNGRFLVFSGPEAHN